MANTLQSMVQTTARTTGGCDEMRFDMLRHTVCLLKYYGFSCTKNSIKHRNDINKTFIYYLVNPTWMHLEDEIRADLKTVGIEEDQMPPRYPDTPKVDPSPLKNPEIQQKAIFISGIAEHMPRVIEDYKERPFF
jgi:hypothetical protein